MYIYTLHDVVSSYNNYNGHGYSIVRNLTKEMEGLQGCSICTGFVNQCYKGTYIVTTPNAQPNASFVAHQIKQLITL